MLFIDRCVLHSTQHAFAHPLTFDVLSSVSVSDTILSRVAGASKDIGTALTRICMRHRSVEVRVRECAG